MRVEKSDQSRCLSIPRDRVHLFTGPPRGGTSSLSPSRHSLASRSRVACLPGHRRRRAGPTQHCSGAAFARPDRKSVVLGKRVSVRVDLGGGRNFKKKNNNNNE